MPNLSEANFTQATGMSTLLMGLSPLVEANAEKDNTGRELNILEGSSGTITLPGLIEWFFIYS